jgi:soluble lytic murein transglycosylase-like protein
MKNYGLNMRFSQKFNLLMFAACVIFIAPTAYADIYKYTDKRGRVILTDTPKNSKYVKLVKTWKGWVPLKTGSISYKNLEKNRKKHSGMIDYMANRYKLPKSLIHAVITAESAYDSNAVSRAGAVGLMQLMPGTARRYGVKNRRNPYQNISAGTQYLRDLLIMYDNNLQLVLAAYNAGEGAVKKYNNTIPPYKETQNYVKKVIAYYHKYKQSMG